MTSTYPLARVVRWAVVGLSAAAFGASTTLAQELTNAVEARFGPKVTIEVKPPETVLGRDTPVTHIVDGNARSRAVVTGVPYTFEVELLDKLPIVKMAFSASGYATELSPKDLLITLDDGSTFEFTMERKLPVAVRNVWQPAWQEIAIGKQARTIRITVKSVHPGEVNWGGLGELAIYTSENLAKRLVVPSFEANRPAFVHQPPVAFEATPTRMPPRVQPGEFPRTWITKGEVAAWREAMKAERAQAPLRTLMAKAAAALEGEVVFPDPKGPLSQLRDRNDAVMRAHNTLSNRAGDLGRAYLLTGEERFAARAAEILRGYAQRYADYPEHKGVNQQDTGKISSQRLSEAMWYLPLVKSYDLIHDSPALSKDDHTLIQEKLLRACVQFIFRRDFKDIVAERDRLRADWRTVPGPKARGNVGNWLLFYNGAAMLTGAVLDDRHMLDVAIANLRQLLVNGIGDDGMWNEGAIGYQYFAMLGMLPAMETAARQGVDLWGFDNARLKRLYDMPRYYAYPDGSMPGINDSGRSPNMGWQGMCYDYAYARYGDDRYASIINATGRQVHYSEGVYMPTLFFSPLPEPARVVYPSMLFGSLGYAIARDDDRYVLMDYGQHGGVHGHYDKLNLLVFGGGDEVLGEPQFRRYEDSLHKEFVVQTIAHNTMAVDGRSQMADNGRLLAYDVSGPVKIIRGESAAAYPGVVLDRTVVFTADAVFDVFRAQAGMTRSWYRPLAAPGDLDKLPAFEGGNPLGRVDGFQHIKVGDAAPADGGWSGTWKHAKGALSASVAAAKGMQVRLGKDVDNRSQAILVQRGTTADYGMMYVFNAAPEKLLPIDTGSADVAAYESPRSDGSADRVYVHSKSGPWKAAGMESDASVVHVKLRGGAVESITLTGGTFARYAGRELKLDAPGNAHAVVQAGNVEVRNRWSPAAGK